MKRTTLALLLLAVAAGAVFAQPMRGKLRLRVSGWVGAAPEGVPPVARWVVDAGGERYDFTADRIDVLTGNASPGNVTQMLDPYTPAFRLRGVNEAVQSFRNTPPGQRIALIGVLRVGAGARIFMLERVEELPEVTPRRQRR
jgi:hypothetical protein